MMEAITRYTKDKYTFDCGKPMRASHCANYDCLHRCTITEKRCVMLLRTHLLKNCPVLPLHEKILMLYNAQYALQREIESLKAKAEVTENTPGSDT